MTYTSMSQFIIKFRKGTTQAGHESTAEVDVIDRCWLWYLCSTSFLWTFRTTSPGTTLPTMTWVFPHQSSTMKMHFWVVLGPVWQRPCQLRVFLPKVTQTFYQVGLELAITWATNKVAEEKNRIYLRSSRECFTQVP